jgi:PIN domain nuclease of toxin-antitoxin system
VKLLLDTHLALWWQSGDIAPAVRGMVENAEAVFVSRASLWELCIELGRGRLDMDLQMFCDSVERDGFQWLEIAQPHLLAVAGLPQFDDHKDPFDRLLAAQSLSEPLILLTVDARLARYGSTVRVVQRT